MFIASFPAPMYATNCWIIAGKPGQECIIVDPGMPDISHEITAIIEENNLKPVAALITHGHLDHTYSVKPLADGYGIASYIHSEDREYLLKPQGAHGAEFIATLDAMSFEEPADTRNQRNPG